MIKLPKEESDALPLPSGIFQRLWPLVLDLLGLSLVAAGVLLFVYAGFLWYGAHAAHHSRYITARAEFGHIEHTVSALGTLQPVEFVDVGTQVTGQLKTLHVAVGQEVRKGDLVAELDPALFASRKAMTEAALAVARAQLTEKEAQERLAKLQYERNQGLYRKQAVSEELFQQSKAAYEQASATLEELTAQIKSINAQLDGDKTNLLYTKILAPISGTVVSLSAREGQTLVATQLAPIIMRIADLDTMTVWAQVSEADILKIKPGMQVYFSPIASPGQRWDSRVRRILPTPETVNNVVLYDVLFDVPNPNRVLKSQMSAQARFVIASVDHALLVPVAALRTQPSTLPPERASFLMSSAWAKNPRHPQNDSPTSEHDYFIQVLRDNGEV